MSYNVSVSAACPVPYLGPSLAQTCPGSQFLMFMTLLDTFVRAKDEISHLCERVKPIDPAEYYYDFIVIGGEYTRQFDDRARARRSTICSVISIEPALKCSHIPLKIL